MEHYLVRKRPFAEHEVAAAAAAARGSSSKRPRGQQPTPGAQRHSASSSAYSAAASSTAATPAVARHSGFATAASLQSSSAAASRSSYSSHTNSHSSSSSSGVGGGSWRPPPVLKQLSLTQLSKVTVVDDVAARAGILSAAFARSDWRKVAALLRELESLFISKTVLEKTGIGKLLTNIKNSLRQQQQTTTTTTDAAPPPREQMMTASAAPVAATPAAETANNGAAGSAEEYAAQVDEEVEELSPPTSGRSSSSSASAGVSAQQLPQLQSSCVSLATSLLQTWRAQVKKELAAEQASGAGGGPALEFNQHSTLKNRVATYKALYYLLTTRDQKESAAETEARRRTMRPLLARDAPAAALASELECMLFRYHRDMQRQRHLANSRSELLSAAPAQSSSSSSSSTHGGGGGSAKDDEACLTTEPPSYAPHARGLLATLRLKSDELDSLRRWIRTGSSSSPGNEDEEHEQQLTKARRTAFEALLRRTRF